ncbi:hypothetical protein Jiend_04310 [Micromonospora endophytica]|nr:hypothetical protein Jiend_04310 [Micromonospora endophytica]
MTERDGEFRAGATSTGLAGASALVARTTANADAEFTATNATALAHIPQTILGHRLWSATRPRQQPPQAQ